MNHGRVEQVDAAERVFEQPRTAFVAEFMGAANYVGERSIVRPEKLKLAAAPLDGMSCTAVRVEDRAYQGLGTVWTVRNAAGGRLLVYEQNASVIDGARIDVGRDAYVCWDARHVVTLGEAT
jgi:ABC-type Fe3+/spermidine/putrescine transport system ATPase subunit